MREDTPLPSSTRPVGGLRDCFDGDDPSWAVAATFPKPRPIDSPQDALATELSMQLLTQTRRARSSLRRFVPQEPEAMETTGIAEAQVEGLLLKFLANRLVASGREASDQIRLPFRIVRELLRRMKDDRLVVYKAASAMADYVYELTELGFERARRYAEHCTYFGAAPVSLDDYTTSVKEQSIRLRHPTMDDLRRAFGDLLLGEEIISQLGQALSSGLGLFLFGSPGNGKTSIAERITSAYGETIWIPRAVSVLGEIIRLYDPLSHQPMPAEEAAICKEAAVDRRWVLIRRPTIVAGGELTLDSLELSSNSVTGLAEAPLQMKANGGAMVIDDFGRQRITPAELLNRWIVPLEKRYDFLSLVSGRKIQVPFDQLIIFSTNLEPHTLVDEAFLRRIPYKIDVRDPSEDEFRRLFERGARQIGIEYHAELVDWLIAEHYKGKSRPMRFCHPRDLLHQVAIFCRFHGKPLVLSAESLGVAVKNYFAMMQ